MLETPIRMKKGKINLYKMNISQDWPHIITGFEKEILIWGRTEVDRNLSLAEN